MLIRDNQICQFGIRRLPFGATSRFQLSLLRQQPCRGWPVGWAVQRKAEKVKGLKDEEKERRERPTLPGHWPSCHNAVGVGLLSDGKLTLSFSKKAYWRI